MTSAMQPSFAAGELSPSLWGRVDLAKYHIGVKTLKNFIVHPHGGASNRPGTIYVGEIPGECRLIPFEFSVEQTYMLVFTDYALRIIKDGGFVVYPGGHPDAGQRVVIATPYAVADLPLLKYTQSFDSLFLTHPSYAPRRLTRTDHHEWTFSLPTFEPTAETPTGLTATASTAIGSETYYYRAAYYILNSIGGVPGPWRTAWSDEVSAVVADPWAGTVTITWGSRVGFVKTVLFRKKGSGGAWELVAHFDNQYSHTDDGSVQDPLVSDYGTELSPGQYAGGTVGPTLTVSYQPVSGDRTYRYMISQVVDGQESFPSDPAEAAIADPWEAGVTIALSCPALPTAESYEFYKNPRGQWGWIGSSKSPTFLDDNIDPDLSFGPRQEAIVEFDAVDNYPGAVALYQQRLCYARTNAAPSTLWTSRTGDLYDFSISDPIRDDDPIEARPATGRADEIRHLVPFDGLLVFTAGAEWMMRGAGDNSLRVSNVEFQVQSYYGCSHVQPLVMGNSVLFLQRNGRIVRDFAYNLESDGYAGNDMTVLARHLTEDATIVDWAYALNPDGMVWAVKSDGGLLGFTYMREHDVHAWGRHETSGTFTAVGAIAGDESDDVFFCVKRVIGGNDKYYIEQLAERVSDGGVFLDCSLTYSGAPATTISGLSHLEGRTVTALADGTVVNNLTVTAGAVTLPHSASEVHVGLPYVSDLQTLDLDVNQPGGTNQGRRQKVSQVVVRMRDTSAFWIGPDSTHLLEAAFRTVEGYEQETQLFTGDKVVSVTPQWGRSATVFVRQIDPLPVTILGILPEIEVGG